MDNNSLKVKYDEMHSVGRASWFDEGDEERQTILRTGEPWDGLNVVEIGCGEGELSNIMTQKGSCVLGLDYSREAIDRASKKYYEVAEFSCEHYRNRVIHGAGFDALVMQGVLEHLDNPLEELNWMIDHFKPKTVITSSPCFLNTRGVVWHTLNMLGAVMSKTDLHYLDPVDFNIFCRDNGYKFSMATCEMPWGYGEKMIQDLKKRIPLALKDGNIPFKQKAVDEFIEWLGSFELDGKFGAVAVYRIDINS